ncbi:probable serine carboxypeptidase CPVL [Mugil cephalus]|uniref:probable serine carboxypeptidase CPVL n=1 Tax=Mugil cephalus TaxID=48193 RepID=UPI001FB731B4|nr:probable serine carboxypeptidase CPVL [Mugil cephalus]
MYLLLQVGTGFSFTDNDAGYAQNQDDVGRDLYSALTQFFQIFPDYQSNDFYVAGESYGGKHVPTICHYIHKNNPSAEVKINLKGMAIGNGFCDPELIVGGYGEFLYQTGIIDELQKHYFDKQTDLVVQYIHQKNWKDAVRVFRCLLYCDGKPNSTYFQKATGCTNVFNYMTCQKPDHLKYATQFVTLPAVRQAIHVGKLRFHNMSEVEMYLVQDVMKSIKPWLGVLMDNYRVLMYNGQLDVLVAVPLTERFLTTVNWTGAAEYKKAPRFYWKIQPNDTEVAGYVRQVKEFYQVVVRGGGHILPYDQPERSFDMIDRFLSKRGWKNPI